MEIRRYREYDVPQMILHLKRDLQDYHYGQQRFSERKVHNLLMGNLGNGQFFCNVIDIDGEITGALCGSIVEYMTSYDVYAQDYIFHIRPGFASLKGARLLVKSWVEFAAEQGCVDVRIDQSTGYKMDKFVAFMKRQGFDQIGTRFRKEL